MVQIGDKMTFTPSAWVQEGGLALLRAKTVTGTVDFIHRAHRWYRVRYELDTFCGRVVGYECFTIAPEGDQRADDMPIDGGKYRDPKRRYVARERLPEKRA